MPLVTGYDSDSDDDKETLGVKPEAGTVTLNRSVSENTPKTVNARNETVKDASNLNGNNNNNKRKAERFQIRIETVKGEDGDSFKKTKLEAAEKEPGGHSLLNMLPAPKHKKPILPAKKKDENFEEEINNFGLQSSNSSSGAIMLMESEIPKNKAKGNNDFRAMLGLKNSSNTKKALNVTQEATTSVAQKQGQKEQQSPASEEFASITPEEKKISLLPQPFQRSAFTISAAPTIEDEQSIEPEISHENLEDQGDPYSGWQQGPDGKWFPVTPEAHEQYQRALIEQSERESVKEDSFQFGQSHGSHIPTTNSDIDRKYALAAASVAGPGQYAIHFSDENGEGEKKNEKSINLRAKRKGQLSSLIAQAEEKKDKLEEKWAKGRSARNEAKSKYGF